MKMALHSHGKIIFGECRHFCHNLLRRSVQTSACVQQQRDYKIKNLRAGRPKISQLGNKPLTYQQAQPPYRIGVTKAWDSWNTANLHGENGAHQIMIEDAFIRKFMVGTWQTSIMSDIIIKRRYNVIIIATLIKRTKKKQSQFLIGYTEELLSHFLKCPVKLELQVESGRLLPFKKI